tara:strand:+ start:137 stop:811 length:675 start_codon:yes stop_codon:yes gene_type:complete
MKKNIAHIITLTSLCIGIFSIIESCKFNFITSSYLILLSVLLDGLDGMIARYLKSVSEFGKQLDSFSDMIAFGIAPGILIYNFFIYQFDNQSLAYISLLIPICSSLRLAKYNISKRSDMFLGLTTPVSALLFSALPLISTYERNFNIWNAIINELSITTLIITISILLISPLKTFNLRIDSIRHNKSKLFFIFISVCVLYLFNFTGLPIIILIYILLNVMKVIN